MPAGTAARLRAFSSARWTLQVVGHDGVVRDARDQQEQARPPARAVLARRTVDDGGHSIGLGEGLEHAGISLLLLEDECLHSRVHELHRLTVAEVAGERVGVASIEERAQVRGGLGGVPHGCMDAPGARGQPGTAVGRDVGTGSEIDDGPNPQRFEDVAIVAVQVRQVSAAEDDAFSHTAATFGGVAADVAEVGDGAQRTHENGSIGRCRRMPERGSPKRS
jgi:hypothetical protein